MSKALFFDTETTGLPLFSEPSEHPAQPHIVQLAACLVDLDTRTTLASLDVIIRPDGWDIPQEVSAIHGITTEMAMDLGVPEGQAVDMFLALWGNRHRIAHNESFDARILRIAIKRHLDSRNEDLLVPLSDEWKNGQAECTARLSTPICRLPPTAKMLAAKRNNHKTPKLTEAYLHFFGKEFENAHSALADVRACMDVYFAIKDGKPAFAA